MSLAVPVAIPRWQWRTAASDLSRLFRRFPASTDAGERIEEIHLICSHSSHSVVLTGQTLELRWRKETRPDGLELWDTILRTSLPYRGEDLARLWATWGVAATVPGADYFSVTSFLDEAIRPHRSVLPARVVRQCRHVTLHGIVCSLEQVIVGSIEKVDVAPATRFDSFAIEHEDPSLMTQVLASLGLDARDNINFLQGLRNALELPALDVRNRTWPKKSNASI